MRDSRRLPAWTAGLIFAGFAFLAGCLNSEERGTLHADGSGEIRFAYSMPEGKVDQDKKQEVHEAMAKARGIKILSDVDSTAGDTLWVGMVIHFDSIAVLDQLNDILPLKGTFQEMSWKRQNGENTLERTVRLIPAMPKDMGMPVKLPTYVQTIHWKVPGTIVSTDPLGTKSEDGSVASWKLPTDGASGTEAHLKLVWTDAGVTRVQLPWKGIALGALGLLLAFVLLVAWRFWRGRKEAVAIPDAPTTAAADPIMDVQAAEPLLSNPDPDEPSNRPLDFAT